uniref:Uncharacterized protein n=1 Tax=Rhizophora mucronata TaxID=61149 RepID=A0A2P2QQU8_RHIMU
MRTMIARIHSNRKITSSYVKQYSTKLQNI